MEKPTYKIEKNVPIPDGRCPALWESMPFEDMEIDDSFLIKGEGAAVGGNRVYSANKHFKSKGMPNKYQGMKRGREYRIWRIE